MEENCIFIFGGNGNGSFFMKTAGCSKGNGTYLGENDGYVQNTNG